MKRLEDDTGSALFLRRGRGMALTAHGASLLGYARRILALHDEAVASFQRAGAQRTGAPGRFGELCGAASAAPAGGLRAGLPRGARGPDVQDQPQAAPRHGPRQTGPGHLHLRRRARRGRAHPPRTRGLDGPAAPPPRGYGPAAPGRLPLRLLPSRLGRKSPPGGRTRLPHRLLQPQHRRPSPPPYAQGSPSRPWPPARSPPTAASSAPAEGLPLLPASTVTLHRPNTPTDALSARFAEYVVDCFTELDAVP